MSKVYPLMLLAFVLGFVKKVHAQCGTDPATSATLTVSSANLIPNSYYPGTLSPASGTNSIVVGTIDSRGNTAVLAAGDLIIVMQMQGAEINSSNSDAFGDGATGAPANGLLSSNLVAGLWEYANVQSVSGTTLTLSSNLVNSYFTRAYSATNGTQSYQVIRIPRYYTINVASGFSVTCPAWNGSTGGVVALDASNVMTINGSILANAKGFRGAGGFSMSGVTANNSSSTSSVVPIVNSDYRFVSTVTNTNNLTGGAKGEGIAGTPPYTLTTGNTLITSVAVEGYVGGAMGRGAPGNAGGGGSDGQPSSNGYNTGGGGGSNYGAGGNGGSGWYGSGGNSSTYPYGGYGGAAFTVSGLRRLIMGGGGGAGSANNSSAAQQYLCSGASGGGIIILRAASYAGTTGILNADGANALAITGSGNTDAAGGGGAGGTIVAVTRTNTTVGLTGVTASARGGRGGNMENYYDHGPGGGGGGGLIITNGTFSGTPAVNAGTNGLTRTGSQGGAIDNAYGASPGTTGLLQTLANAPTIQNASGGTTSCGVLPINITSFTASLDGSSVLLDWHTADAINFSRFEIEWSNDGSNWQSLGTVVYDESRNKYDFQHAPVTTPNNYYRLKLVDRDNSFLYSSTVLVQVRSEGNGLTIYPQPAHGRFNVNLSVSRNQQSLIRIFNASGAQVHQVNVRLNRGNNGFVVSGLERLVPGVYLLKVDADGKEQTRKLVIN